MGFLKNLIKNAIDDGISKGISKGISNAVGSAAEKILKPKAEEVASQAAKEMDAAASSMAEATNSIQQASDSLANDAAKNVNNANTANANAASANGNGFAALESALNSWSKSAEQYATQMSKNMKQCPKCGEYVTADKQFCPECGAKLPDKTVADDAVCPKCGAQNTPGTSFCAKCGTKLPGAIAAEQKAAADDAAVLAEWNTKLAGFPVWPFGGKELSIEENGEGPDGNKYYYFTVHQTSVEALNKYVVLLKTQGFVRQWKDSDETLFKDLGGTYLVFNQTEAVYDDTTISVGMFRTTDRNSFT